VTEQPANLDTKRPAAAATVWSFRALLRGWARDLFVAAGLAAVIIVFLYQPVKVEGTSMSPLLVDQERIFINKFVYRFGAVERGDVVVFWYPRDRTKSFIKRVVGLPGEQVEIRRGRVFVNGEALEETYLVTPGSDASYHGPVQVPEGHYFVLGDHRSSSNDSRLFGPVSESLIYGKAVFAYWPVDRFGAIPEAASSVK
jgi:signal peptidase I